MKKAKNIMKKMSAGLGTFCKKLSNVHLLTRVILVVAAAMIVIAGCVVLFSKPARQAVMEVVSP